MRGCTVRALVARYYDPTTATFLTTDPLEALTGTPYSYADDNPLNIEDPSGMCWFCVSAITNVLSGVSEAAGLLATGADAIGLAPVGGLLGAASAVTAWGAAGVGCIGGVGNCTDLIANAGLATVTLGVSAVLTRGINTAVAAGARYGPLAWGRFGIDLFGYEGPLLADPSGQVCPTSGT